MQPCRPHQGGWKTLSGNGFLWQNRPVKSEKNVIEPVEARVESSSLRLAWYCLRSQVKQEHIAAKHLQGLQGVEVFLPRIRFRRATRRGPVWFTEAMFPNYLFARFDWQASLQAVNAQRGVNTVVHFGSRWPTLPDPVINDLRATVGEEQIRLVPADLAPGDKVRIAGGVFHGLEAVITQVLSNRERVRVLMEFLGRQSAAELNVGSVVRELEGRQAVL
jgi:transcriptional antiterminator RfaH